MDEMRTSLVGKVNTYLSRVTEREVSLTNENTDHKNTYNIIVDGQVLDYTFPGGYKAKFVMPFEGMLFAEKEFYDEVIELIKDR